MTIIRSLIVVTAAIAAAGLPSIACAEAPADPDDPVRIQVDFADLDLGSPDGVKLLQKRVTRAAKKLCFGNHGRRALWEREEAAACNREALASATPQVDLAVSRAESERLASASEIVVARR